MTYSAPQRAEQQTQAQIQTASEQTSDDEMMLTVTVSNKRLGPLSGLSKEAFTVIDDKTPREITSFSNDDVPHSIGLIFDMSESMDGSKLTRHAVQFFDDFLNASNKANEYFIMAFAARPQIVVDWTTDISGLLAKMATKNTRRPTALYDALYLGIEKAKSSQYNRRALILLTDAQDNESKYTFSEVRQLLKESDVLLYALIMADEGDRYSPLGIEAKSILSELTSITGGRLVYLGRKERMKEVFETLAAEMRYQYRLGFKPLAATGKPRWHSIKVKVTPPQNAPAEFRSLVVRSREGYYSDKRPR